MRSTTQAQRLAASKRLQARRAGAVRGRATSAGIQRNAVIPVPAGVFVCNAPTGAANADYMGLCPNWSNSPQMRKFVDALPGLGPGQANTRGQFIPIAQPIANPLFPNDDYYELGIVEYREQMHSDLPAIGTKLRGYVDLNSATPTPHYLGPLILARRDKPVRLKVTNMLGTGAAGKLFIPVDTTVMGAGFGPDGSHVYTDNRAVVHLHGGNTPWISDGTPHQWFTPKDENGTIYKKGDSFQNVPDMIGATGSGAPVENPNNNDGVGTYYYTNQQSARLMFYHDHSYGTTRLNVYAGEAAGYLVTDAVEDDLITRGVIPGAPLDLATNVYAYGVPLIIQDKTFVAGSAAAGTGTFATDPTWTSVVPAGTQEGDLWFPHVYMPNQNPADNSGAAAMGRWDYGPWFWPPYTGLQFGAVPCPTADNPAQTCPGTPNPSKVPEAFMDTPVINGTAYPFVQVEAKPYRFRVLNATNDRHLNLGLYLAEPLTIMVTDGGSGYVAAPLVTITPAPGDPGTGATATATVSTGSVNGVILQAGGGVGYTAPVITFTGGGGTGAAGIAQLDAQGGILAIALTSGGSGYTSAPTVTIQDPTGSGASAIATITPAGSITSITVTNPGAGYLAAPTIAIDPPPAPGLPAIAVASVNTEVRMTDAVPHPLLNGGPGLPACAAAPPADQIYLGGVRTGLPQFCWPASWPTDGRVGGVPDPTTAGPAIIQIGTEGGLLPNPVVIPSQPVGYNYNRRDIVVLNVQEKGLFMGPAERADIIVDFSGLAGKTLILYNDAPAPVPAFDPRFDYYTGDPDQTQTGGAPTTLPGYGPNTRTMMQIRVVAPSGTATPLNLATLQTELPKAFAASFPLTDALGNPGHDRIIVPEPAFNAAYNPATPYTGTYSRIQDTKMTFTPVGGAAPVTFDMQPKAIQELFTVDYGQMNATLGVELPNTNVQIQTTIPLAYIDPPTEVINDGETQIWKITHNGVDTHAVHFHLFNVQIVNRVGWDGAIRPPEPNEVGWKETVRMNPLEDAIVALRPMKQNLSGLAFGIPESQRLLDVTHSIGTTGQFTNIDPLTNNPVTVTNQMANFGWEYVWHCHLLGHEENDMMRPMVFKVQPIRPPVLSATTNNTPQVLLSWTYTNNAQNPATGFRLYRTQGANTILLATLTNMAQRALTDSAVAFNTQYTYKMVAFNATGVSIVSNIVTVTTPSAAPQRLPSPSNLRATLRATTSITMGWNAVPGATQYILERLVGANWQIAGTTTGLTFRVTGLTTRTTYQFRVSAGNGNPNTQSLPSAPVSASTL